MEKKTITQEDVENAIRSMSATTLGEKTTVVCLTLTNGFEVVATSSCVDASNYEFNKGKEIALERAKDKVWELLGFALQESLFKEKQDV